MNLFELFVKLGVKDEASSSISSLSDKLKTGLASAAKVATAAIAAASTAIVAFGKSAVDVGKQFDSAMAQVAATMGYTVEELNTAGSDAQQTYTKLRDFAQEMGATTVFSARQAADALNYMALAGYDAETSMEMLPNVLNLAASGSIDLARASDMVTDAQTALGLSLDETSTMVDQMAKTASKSNTSVEQLGEAILTIGGTAQFMAGGTDRLATVLGVLADNGIKGSEAGTHLRNMLLKLSAPTDDGAAALNQLGVEVFDTEGKMRDLSDIFLDLNNNMNDTTTMFENWYRSQAMSESTWENFKKNGGKVEEFTKNTTLFGISLIDASGKMKSFDKYMKEVNSTFNKGVLSDEAKMKALSEIFNTRDVAAATALMTTSVERWNELGEAILDAEGAAEAMAEVQLDNLEGDITLFKSALEGAQIVISDTLTPTLREFVQYGSNAISTLSMAFKEGGLEGAMSSLGTLLSDGLNMLIEKLPMLVSAGGQLLGALAKGIVDNFPTIVKAAQDIISEIVKNLSSEESVQSMFTSAIEMLTSLARGLATLTPDLLSGIVSVVTNVIKVLSDPAQLSELAKAGADIIKNLVAGIPDAFNALAEAVGVVIDNFVSYFGDKENQDNLIEGAKTIIRTIADGIVGAIQWIIDSARTLITNIVNFLGNEESRTRLLDAAGEIVGEIKQGIINVVSTLGTAATEVITSLTGFLTDKDAMENLGTTAGEIVGKIVSSIIEFAVDLFEAGAEILTKLGEYFEGQDALTIFDTIGDNILGAIWAAMLAAWNEVKPTLDKISEKLQNYFAEIDWEDTGKKIMDNFFDSLVRKSIRDEYKLKKLWDNLKSWFLGLDWEAVGQAILDSILNTLTFGIYGLVTGNTGDVLGKLTSGAGKSMSEWDERYERVRAEEEAKIRGEETADLVARVAAEMEKQQQQTPSIVNVNISAVPMTPQELSDEIEYAMSRSVFG